MLNEDAQPFAAVITMFTGGMKKVYALTEYNTIGRDHSMSIFIEDPLVSRRHLRIERKPDGYYVRDLRSKLGTLLNGSQIIEAKLQSFDRLRIGNVDLVFTLEKDVLTSDVVMNTKNKEWQSQLQRLPSIAQSPHPVLIAGPSGSGKELIANQLHKMSNRASGPFLSVNCSALTESLAESELFGHRKGSFTGSQEARRGAFAVCQGGTLFLDEIGDMPLNIQPKFLRALENGEIKPVGSDNTEPTDVRIIAATNRNLVQLVSDGFFREDLYYRIHILQIRPPALCERYEDFDTLVHHFARPMKVRFTPDAYVVLREHKWPGNIRELRNMVMRASALYPDIPISKTEVQDVIDLPRPTEVERPPNAPRPVIAKQQLLEYERQAIIERLSYYDGNQRKTAEDMGLAKSTLHDRIRRYGINVQAFRKNIDGTAAT